MGSSTVDAILQLSICLCIKNNNIWRIGTIIALFISQWLFKFFSLMFPKLRFGTYLKFNNFILVFCYKIFFGGSFIYTTEPPNSDFWLSVKSELDLEIKRQIQAELIGVHPRVPLFWLSFWDSVISNRHFI